MPCSISIPAADQGYGESFAGPGEKKKNTTSYGDFGALLKADASL